MTQGEFEYLVRWEGFLPAEDSWVSRQVWSAARWLTPMRQNA